MERIILSDLTHIDPIIIDVKTLRVMVGALWRKSSLN